VTQILTKLVEHMLTFPVFLEIARCVFSFLQIDNPEFEIPPQSKIEEKNYLEVTYQRLKKGKKSCLV